MSKTLKPIAPSRIWIDTTRKKRSGTQDRTYYFKPVEGLKSIGYVREDLLIAARSDLARKVLAEIEVYDDEPMWENQVVKAIRDLFTREQIDLGDEK